MDTLISKNNTWMKLARIDRAKSMTKLLNLVDGLVFDHLIQRIDDDNYHTKDHSGSSFKTKDIDFIIKRENICKRFRFRTKMYANSND